MVEVGEGEEVQQESSVARPLGPGAAAHDWTMPAEQLPPASLAVAVWEEPELPLEQNTQPVG